MGIEIGMEIISQLLTFLLIVTLLAQPYCEDSG